MCRRRVRFTGQHAHAARVHEGQAVSHGLALEDALARDGADAAVGERAGKHRQLLRVLLDGARLEVELQVVQEVAPGLDLLWVACGR